MAVTVLTHEEALLTLNDWIGREVVVALDGHGALDSSLFEASGVLEHLVGGGLTGRLPRFGYDADARRADELAGHYILGDVGSLHLTRLPGTWALRGPDDRLTFVLAQGEFGELMPGPAEATYEVTLTLSVVPVADG